MDVCVSVIIPTCNALELLRKTIESLEKQIPDSPIFDVIVVDDGSSDGTANWLGGYSGPLELKSVIQTHNQGRSAARNRGVAAARGRWLILLDGDMLLTPDFVKAHIESHREEGLAVIGRVVFDPGLQPRGLARYLEGRGGMKFQPGQALPGRFFLSGNSSLSREMFDAVGGFDESLKSYGEDIDFGVRLKNAGCRIIQNPALQSTHLHLRSLTATLELAYNIGARTYPELVRRHSELYQEFHLSLALSRGSKSAFLRTLVCDLFYQPLKMIGILLSRWRAPSLLYQYLLFRNLLKGFQDGGGEKYVK